MANIQIRISKEEKAEIKKVLDSLGLNFSSAIKVFLRQVVEEKRIPFEIKVKSEKIKPEKEIQINPFERRKIA